MESVKVYYTIHEIQRFKAISSYTLLESCTVLLLCKQLNEKENVSFNTETFATLIIHSMNFILY